VYKNMPLGRISHSWSGGHLASILKLPVNAKFLARGFYTTEDKATRKPLPRRPLPANPVAQASKPQASNKQESTQLISQLQKLLSKEKPSNPAFNEFSQRRQIR
jgi:hypothetical protein